MSAIIAAVSVRDALDSARIAIGAAGSTSPALDAELLLADALGTTREWLRREPDAPLTAEATRAFRAAVTRRSREREPVAYILGRRAFRRIELAVDRRVLIPRPETELLVELALELPHGAAVLDCATGSGAIALALADERPDLSLSGSDLDEGALAVARANSARLRLSVVWRRADLLDGLPDEYDAIVANVPYVAREAFPSLEPEVTHHEPRLALDGGPGGLEVLVRLIVQAGGRGRVRTLILEHGDDQAPAVAGACAAAGFPDVELRHDLAGLARAVRARR
jgi:release factor glutamine methyltransferase